MKTKYTILRDWEGRTFIVPKDEISYNAPSHDKYQNGIKYSAYDAGDYSLENSESSAEEDMKKEGIKIFGDSFKDVELDSDLVACNLEEIGLEDKEEKINEFISTWEEENRVDELETYITWWDGSNYQSKTIGEDPWCELKEMPEEEAEEILKAYEEAREYGEWEECQNGSGKFCGIGEYIFHISYYSVFYTAEVENN